MLTRHEGCLKFLRNILVQRACRSLSGHPSDAAGSILGWRVDREPTSEAGHFIRCPTCGGYIDLRDLADRSQ
jgi:hypothetical protein